MEHWKLFPAPPKSKEKIVVDGRNVTRFYNNDASLITNQDDNPKLKKSKRNSYILYLAPAKYGKLKEKDGTLVNTCPNASPECIATCLNTAGNPAFKEKIPSRIDKTAFYVNFKEIFLMKLAREIWYAAFRHTGYEVAIRVNGTSDLPIVDEMMNRGYLDKIPKNVVFYDYTKNPMGAGVFKLKSGHYYVVTFSRSETNTLIAQQLLKKGCNVAIPFRGKKLPKKWKGFDVIDADMADDIMIDLAYGEYRERDPETKKYTGKVYKKGPSREGYVFGLRAKGSLRSFQSKKYGKAGFVIDCDSLDNCTVG